MSYSEHARNECTQKDVFLLMPCSASFGTGMAVSRSAPCVLSGRKILPFLRATSTEEGVHSEASCRGLCALGARQPSQGCCFDVCTQQMQTCGSQYSIGRKYAELPLFIEERTGACPRGWLSGQQSRPKAVSKRAWGFLKMGSKGLSGLEGGHSLPSGSPWGPRIRAGFAKVVRERRSNVPNT